jgi:hypothetical protein
LYPLPSIPYLRLRFTLRAVASCRLPEYKGSLLRGAFGHALRRAVCAVGPQQECASCRLRRVCVNTRLFETFIEVEPPPFLRGLPTSPRPYVFEPATEEQDFAPGDPLTFDLLLFGQAIELQAFALLSVERMVATGLGRDRHPFALDRVAALGATGSWTTVFADGVAPPLGALAPSQPPTGSLGDSRIVLRFLTPTRLPDHGELAAPMRFRSLAFLMLRRVLELAHFHVPGSTIDWTFRPLLEQAGAVHVVEPNLRWKDWTRWSNRQQRKNEMGGYVGELTLEGDLAPFVPLLRSAEIVHVGKGATFGLGRVAVATPHP